MTDQQAEASFSKARVAKLLLQSARADFYQGFKHSVSVWEAEGCSVLFSFLLIIDKVKTFYWLAICIFPVNFYYFSFLVLK